MFACSDRSRVGAVGGRYKTRYILYIWSIWIVDFLKKCMHLAIGVERELSGADTKTHVFYAPTISESFISFEECSHLATGAEWEPLALQFWEMRMRTCVILLFQLWMTDWQSTHTHTQNRFFAGEKSPFFSLGIFARWLRNSESVWRWQGMWRNVCKVC